MDWVIELDSADVPAITGAGPIIARAVCWRVARGEFWIVTGLMGSGKSGLLRFLAGLLAPSAGQYRLFGEPMPIIDQARLPIRLRLGFVAEDGGLLSALNLAENVALPLRYHKDVPPTTALERARELLRALDCEPWAEAHPGSVPPDVRRRTGLARALIMNPEVLIVDCPLRGLDPVRAHWWLDTMLALNQGQTAFSTRPMTIIVSSEDPRWWHNARAKFLVLHDGHARTFSSWAELEAAGPAPVHAMLASGTQK